MRPLQVVTASVHNRPRCSRYKASAKSRRDPRPSAESKAPSPIRALGAGGRTWNGCGGQPFGKSLPTLLVEAVALHQARQTIGGWKIGEPSDKPQYLPL